MLFNIDFSVIELIVVVGLEFDFVEFTVGFEEARVDVLIVNAVVMDIKTDLVVVVEICFIGAIDVVAPLFVDFESKVKVVDFDVVNVVLFLAIKIAFVIVVDGNVVASVVVDFFVVLVVVGDDVVFVVVSFEIVVFVSFALKFFSVVVFSLLSVSRMSYTMLMEFGSRDKT